MKDAAKTESRLLAETQQLRAQVALLQESKQRQKKLVTALRLAHAYHRSLIETSLDAFIAINLEGKITDVNAAAELITGYSRQELIGSEFSTYLDDPSRVKEGCPQLSSGTPLRNYQLNLRCKEGSIVPVLCNASVFRDETGTLRVWVTAARAISEIKRSEERLREKEIRFHTIADSSINWEYWLEADGTLSYVSPACQKISGYSPQEFQRNPRLLETIVYPDDRAIFKGHRREPLNAVTEPPLEFRILSKTGDVCWIQHRCMPMFSERGQFLGRRATNQDITHRKIIEIEQEQAEKRLRQLTQQLITVQESERRRISQDLHDDIGQGMTAITLRLNTILTSCPPDQVEGQREIREAIESVEALMNQIRQLAYQLRPPALDSMPLSKALASLCSSFAQRSGLAVYFSSDKDLPPIPNVQATVLYRLVQEGLTNTVKHARASSVWISLDYADGAVGLSIEDDGQGFHLNEVEVGMGLQGIRDRFLMLNGNLDIESTAGHGTRLFGSLPLANHSL